MATPLDFGPSQNEADLSSGSPVAIMTLALPDHAGLSGQIDYTIECSDGTESQSVTQTIAWSAARKGSAVTASANALALSTVEPALTDPASTLDVEATFDVTTPAAPILRLTATTSLTPTAFKVRFVIKDI